MKISEISSLIFAGKAESSKASPRIEPSGSSSIQSAGENPGDCLWETASAIAKGLMVLLSLLIDKIKNLFGCRGKENLPLFLEQEEAEEEAQEEAPPPIPSLETPPVSEAPPVSETPPTPETPPSPDVIFKKLPPLKQAEKKRLNWLLDVLANNDVSWLAQNREEVRRIGAIIGNVHSLRNVEYILTNPDVLKKIQAIPQRWLIGQQI